MKEYHVKPDSQLNLDTCNPDDTGEYKNTDQGKEKAKAVTVQLIGRLGELQERLYANGNRAVLIVLQGMDTSGKDGTIKHVMSGVNPQGCRVATFKTPSNSELAHDFLWRVHHEVPAKGQIGIFNRSHYEDVLITRVHKMISAKVEVQRLNQIKEFEELLAENGTTILKFFCTSPKMSRKRGWKRASAIRKSVGSSAKGIWKNGSSGPTISRCLKRYSRQPARSMRPGTSYPPIGNGIEISWSPIVSLTPWKT